VTYICISWTDSVRNEVLHRVKEERHNLNIIKGRKVNCIGLILCGNLVIKHFIDGKIKG